jgi:two-component system chemotaxis response regulator CheB
LKLQLLPKIAALWRFGRSSGATAAPSHTHVAGPQPAETRKPAVSNAVSGGGAAGDSARVELVVIGVSTGGPAALEKLLPMFPADFAVPMMIVQHMPKLFTPVLANRLNQLSGLTVSVAQEGSRVVAGACLFAPGDAHMEVAAPVFSGSSATAHLHTGKPLNSCTPAVDYLFFSAARIYGRGTLAIVLTGMGDDGVAGARAVREAGGTVFAQDQASSAVWGMPGRVSREGIAHQTLSLQSLAYTVQQRVRVGRGEPALQTNYARQAVDDMTDRRTEVIYGLL